MSREKNIGLVLVAAGLIVALAVVAVVASRENRSLYYTLQFKDAKGLKAGDRVQMSGVDIGIVKWVQLETTPPSIQVRIKIDPQYSELVRQRSTAMIHGISFPNVSGQQVVEVINPSDTPPPPPMPKNSQVKGVEGQVDLQLWKISKHFSSDKVGQAIGAMSEGIKSLSDSVKSLALNPNVQKALQDLKGFLAVMKDKGASALEQLKAEWPRIRDELKPALQQLEAAGRKRLADQLQQMIQKIEQTLDAWTKELDPTATTPTPAPKTEGVGREA